MILMCTYIGESLIILGYVWGNGAPIVLEQGVITGT